MISKRLKVFSLLSVVSLIVGVFIASFNIQTVKATEVTYTIAKAALKPDGTVAVGEDMDLSFEWSVSDNTPINSGDTITISLPDTLRFPTTLSGQQLTVNSQPVGTYTLDASTGRIILSFDDAGAVYFAENPLNKGGELSVKVNTSQKVNEIQDPTTITIGNFGGQDLGTIEFEGAGDGDIDAYTFKYGYMDPSDKTLVKWKIVVNGGQDILRGKMTITDTIGEGHTLEGTVRAVRLAYKAGGYKSEADAASGTVISSYPVVVSGNTFTITNGDGSSWGNVYGDPSCSPAVYIEYSTRVTDVAKVSGTLNNSLTVEATNFPTRTINKSVSYDFSSWALAWGIENTQAEIVAKKVLQGKELTAGEFTFGLYEITNGTETLVEEVTNGADGTIAFSPITYSSAGLRSYVVKEIAGSDASVTYSKEVLEYKVNVTKEGDAYLAQVGSPADTTFTNVYTAPTTSTTEATTSTTEATTSTTEATTSTTEATTSTTEATASTTEATTSTTEATTSTTEATASTTEATTSITEATTSTTEATTSTTEATTSTTEATTSTTEATTSTTPTTEVTTSTIQKLDKPIKVTVNTEKTPSNTVVATEKSAKKDSTTATTGSTSTMTSEITSAKIVPQNDSGNKQDSKASRSAGVGKVLPSTGEVMSSGLIVLGLTMLAMVVFRFKKEK